MAIVHGIADDAMHIGMHDSLVRVVLTARQKRLPCGPANLEVKPGLRANLARRRSHQAKGTLPQEFQDINMYSFGLCVI